MEDKIIILMATYNGEKFLEEQLDSLLNQTYKNIEIYISDDGSTDQTISIIRKYEKKDKRIHLSFSDHQGACQNFGNLLRKHNDNDYIMFCDQDDVWMLNKVELCYKAMQTVKKKEVPILVYCEKVLVDEDLNEIKKKKYVYQDSLKSLLCQCHIYGCTMMINGVLAKRACIPVYASMHDHWISLTAALKGEIVKIDRELILYRQHSTNVTGGINQYNIFKKILYWKRINGLDKKSFFMCYQFCQKYKHENNDILNQYLDMLDSKGINRIIYMIKFPFKLDHFFATLRNAYVFVRVKVDDRWKME